VPAGEAYLSGSVQTVCNRFAGLRAHYGIEWRILDTGTRLVPDPGLTINTGNSGVGNTSMEDAVSKRLTIESARTQALLTWHVFESDCISHLDTPVKFDAQPLVPFPTYLWSNNGQPQAFPCKLTLRQVLLGIAYPPPNGYPSGHLDAKGGIHIVSSYDRLFLSVDLVPKSYAQRDQYVIKCVALDGRVNMAKWFLCALPAWIKNFFGPNACASWIKNYLYDYNQDSNDFVFGIDEETLLWDGSWTSADDAKMAALASTRLNYEVSFENMSFLAKSPNPFDALNEPAPSNPVGIGQANNLLGQDNLDNDEDSLTYMPTNDQDDNSTIGTALAKPSNQPALTNSDDAFNNEASVLTNLTTGTLLSALIPDASNPGGFNLDDHSASTEATNHRKRPAETPLPDSPVPTDANRKPLELQDNHAQPPTENTHETSMEIEATALIMHSMNGDTTALHDDNYIDMEDSSSGDASIDDAQASPSVTSRTASVKSCEKTPLKAIKLVYKNKVNLTSRTRQKSRPGASPDGAGAISK
jgi:hypothetical protein